MIKTPFFRDKIYRISETKSRKHKRFQNFVSLSEIDLYSKDEIENSKLVWILLEGESELIIIIPHPEYIGNRLRKIVDKI